MQSEGIKLRKAVEQFPGIRALVIGDIILDHFIWGKVTRISPEAPVPVVNVTHENLMLGGAANVLNNLYSMGASATLCGFIGDDADGGKVLELLGRLSSSQALVFSLADRPTMVKTRIVAQGQQVVRFDRETAGPLASSQLLHVKETLAEEIAGYDVVIVSDYAKGMISPELMACLLPLAKRHGLPVIADPKPFGIEKFTGVTIITPNNHETELMSGIQIDSEESLQQAAEKLQQILGADAVLVTRGETGMALWQKKGITLIPTKAKEVYDVTGAGDTVVAALALGVAAGLNYIDAAELANIAAGIVVAKIGTATVGQSELQEALG